MRRMLGIACALWLMSVAVPAAGKEPPEEAAAAAEGVRSRFLGDWAYVPVGEISGPFITTYASSVSGLGGNEIDIDIEPPPIIPIRTRGLTYLALILRFDAQIALFDRIALRVSGQGEGQLPDTGSSAVALVINGTWGLGGGVTGQLFRNEQMMLSLFADYAFLERSQVSPGSALREIREQLTFTGLFGQQDVHNLQAGPSFAVALNPWLGVVAETVWETEWRTADRFDRAGTNNFIDLRGAASANFWSSRRFPVGVSVFWRQRIPLGGDNQFEFTRRYGGGVFYTGRPYLDVGVELFQEISEREPGNFLLRTDRYYVAPRFRGYF